MRVMMVRIFRFLLFLIFGTGVFGQNQIKLETSTLEVDTVITGLNVPWEIRYGQDDHIWMTERHGIVSRLNPETGDRQILLDLTDMVYQSGESGMLGLALHPGFMDTSHVFLVYTYLDDGIKEKLVRYEYNGEDLVNPFTLIEGIPGNSTHNGSRLLILPDRTLLMTTGDAQDQNSSQNTGSLNGKTLRFNLDGSIPPDNPFSKSPVWSRGHRNAQGLLIAPNGIVYSSEHGPTTDDEINILEKGHNYGWPEVHGFCDEPDEISFCEANTIIEPIYHWTPTIAPSDIIWYDSPSIPEFENTILLSVLKEKMIVRITLNGAGTEVVGTKRYFKNNWGRLRDVLQGPEGELYLATNGTSWSNTDPGTHSIIRLKRVDPTSVNENGSNRPRLRIYPNPVNTALYVEIDSNMDNVEIHLVDMTGRNIERWGKSHMNGGKFKLDMKPLSPGVYGLIIINGKNRMYRKFIVHSQLNKYHRLH